LSEGKIEHGFLQLAYRLGGHPLIVIDGYVGVLWDVFRADSSKQIDLEFVSRYNRTVGGDNVG
jgi:hypothetical protein